jgi:hypothetical protein
LATGEGDAFGRGESHLGRGVEGKLGADFLGESNESKVLDDDGVDIAMGNEAEESLCFG